MARTPSSVETELRLLAGSLESICSDLQRGASQGGDTFEGAREWANYIAGRIDNVSALLTQIHDDVKART